MDWLDPTDEERVILGVVKLAAKSKANVLPPVFLNPGVSVHVQTRLAETDSKNRDLAAQGLPSFRA